MIIQAIIDWCAQALTAIYDALPDIPTFDTASQLGPISTMFEWIGWANWWLPMDQVLIVGALFLLSWAAFYVVDLINWVLTKLHIAGGDS